MSNKHWPRVLMASIVLGTSALCLAGCSHSNTAPNTATFTAPPRQPRNVSLSLSAPTTQTGQGGNPGNTNFGH